MSNYILISTDGENISAETFYSEQAAFAHMISELKYMCGDFDTSGLSHFETNFGFNKCSAYAKKPYKRSWKIVEASRYMLIGTDAENIYHHGYYNQQEAFRQMLSELKYMGHDFDTHLTYYQCSTFGFNASSAWAKKPYKRNWKIVGST